MKVSEITAQPLSTLVSDFYVCQSCSIVDADNNRMLVGSPCATCGAKSEGGLAYFDLSADALVDLMQESFHYKSTSRNMSGSPLVGNNVHRLAVVIYFCTLGEVLLEHFLREIMYALNIPNGVQERILNDSLFARERVEKVFPSLVGEKWKAVLKDLSKNSKLNFEKTVEFYLRVANARNEFLHRGNQWAIPESMPEECMEEIWPLINLYVLLHNRYVPAMNAKQNRKYRAYT